MDKSSSLSTRKNSLLDNMVDRPISIYMDSLPVHRLVDRLLKEAMLDKSQLSTILLRHSIIPRAPLAIHTDEVRDMTDSGVWIHYFYVAIAWAEWADVSWYFDPFRFIANALRCDKVILDVAELCLRILDRDLVLNEIRNAGDIKSLVEGTSPLATCKVLQEPLFGFVPGRNIGPVHDDPEHTIDMDISPQQQLAFVFFAFFEDIHRIRNRVQNIWVRERQGKIDIVSASLQTSLAIDMVASQEKEIHELYKAHYTGSGDTYEDLVSKARAKAKAERLALTPLQSMTLLEGHLAIAFIPLRLEYFELMRQYDRVIEAVLPASAKAYGRSKGSPPRHRGL
ncbi:Uu.00g085600.m01.CDS01 [Anthostomella pinea]|uniref:Uu.00g085600.m01.CDS01 n=1 Tax=Anthostomella pinea TaxID=933095 RepID=A0AAI8VLZ3_9PEZI|nr:Uu.00g085600.m01.CDS01 [Anthostomella pinea]